MLIRPACCRHAMLVRWSLLVSRLSVTLNDERMTIIEENRMELSRDEERLDWGIRMSTVPEKMSLNDQTEISNGCVSSSTAQEHHYSSYKKDWRDDAIAEDWWASSKDMSRCQSSKIFPCLQMCLKIARESVSVSINHWPIERQGHWPRFPVNTSIFQRYIIRNKNTGKRKWTTEHRRENNRSSWCFLSSLRKLFISSNRFDWPIWTRRLTSMSASFTDESDW